MVTDAISDMITRMRNAIQRDRREVVVPQTKMTEGIAKLLAEKTIIDDYSVEEPTGEQSKKTGSQKYIKILLAFDTEKEEKTPRITGIKRVSKPGVRIYYSYKDMPKVRGGFGVSVVSTSKGLMTDIEARKAKLGGEVLFNVW